MKKNYSMKCICCQSKDLAIANLTLLLNKIVEKLKKDENFADTINFNKENILNDLNIQLEESQENEEIKN